MFGHSPERKTPKAESNSPSSAESETQASLQALTLMQADILRMQRLVGNRATQQLVARKSANNRLIQREYKGERLNHAVIRNEKDNADFGVQRKNGSGEGMPKQIANFLKALQNQNSTVGD